MPLEIVANPTDWTQTDQERWANFLDTETGKRLLPALVETAPPLLSKGDINEILIRSGEVRGIQSVIRELVALAHPSVKEAIAAQSTAYPPLEDDKLWDDGQKLSAPPKPETDTQTQE